MRLVVLILLVLSWATRIGYGDVPVLHIEETVSWKQIFDSGFRPKHLEGLERNRCVCENQSFTLRFRDRREEFAVGNGRLSFSFFHDDFLSMVWHQGSEPMTLAEGEKRAAEFRKLFDGYIIQEMTMPRVIDARGTVVARKDENNVKVRLGEYLIWYGFDNSFRTDKPIIPHFYVAWNFPGMPGHKSKGVGDVVRPPVGYEWYSLDPKVDTPSPGVSIPVVNARGKGSPAGTAAGPKLHPVAIIVKMLPVILGLVLPAVVVALLWIMLGKKGRA